MDTEVMDSDTAEYHEAFKIVNVSDFKEKNVCGLCSQLLNIVPIFCLQNEENQIVPVCGRCLHVTENHAGPKWRQIAYENAARYMTFPCSYKNEGCDDIITWDKVLDHEMGCRSATVNCPAHENDVYTGCFCSWRGNIVEVDNHIEQVHKNAILDPPYFEEFPRTSEIYFTHVNTKLAVIVFIKHDDRKYYCCVLINGSDVESQYYRYQVELRDESKENSIILRKNRLEPLGNLHANLANKEKLLEINLDAVEPMVKHQEAGKRISARFGVVMKNKKEMLQVAEANGVKLVNLSAGISNHIKNLPPDESMLSELECPVCNEFMIPPIYICNNGHSLCNECLEKVQSCPNCRSSLENKTRNFTLERLTTKVHYPCKNREIGCGISTTSDKIREHEKICDLTDSPCILKCGERFRKPALYCHILAMHADSVFKLNVVHSREVGDRKETHFAIYTYGEVFRLTIKGGVNVPFKFNVQHLKKENEPPQYRYKLEIIDKSELELNVTVMSVAQAITENPTKTNPVTIPWDLIRPALVENKLFYFRISMTCVKKTK